MNIPKKITIYNYYGHAVYFDDALLGYFQIDNHYALLPAVIKGMDIGYEYVSKNWDQMPGGDKQLSTPPKSLAALENHFKQVATAQKFRDLAAAKRRVRELEAEIARNL